MDLKVWNRDENDHLVVRVLNCRNNTKYLKWNKRLSLIGNFEEESENLSQYKRKDENKIVVESL